VEGDRRIERLDRRGHRLGLGLGENVGRRIDASDYPYKDLSVFAAAYRLSIPVTVHVGIATTFCTSIQLRRGGGGRASYRDFLIFARNVEKLEGGVMLSFGSAIMAPEVYLKALAMARNVAGQCGRQIRNFATAVFDLVPIEGDIHRELTKTDPGYYFRPHKTILVRTVADGGREFLFLRRPSATLPALRQAVMQNNDEYRGDPAAASDLSALIVATSAWTAVHVRPGRSDPSRETGIPRVGVISTTFTPGAGGTVANNLAAMASAESPCSAPWATRASAMTALALRRVVSPATAHHGSGHADLQYTKLINAATGEEDLPRVDFICNTPLDPRAEARSSTGCGPRLKRFDVILFPTRPDQPRRRGNTVVARSFGKSLRAASDKIFMADSRARIDEFRRVVIKRTARRPKKHAANCSSRGLRPTAAPRGSALSVRDAG